MSGDKEQEYFSDGLAEEIINALVQDPGPEGYRAHIGVCLQGTKYRHPARSPRALGVTTILEGSVRTAGNRIRVTAQLITAADGSHLWSQRYDREMDDVFAVQDEIAAAIAEALKVKLALRTAKHQPNLPAYEAYLKYRHYQWGFTPESLQLSRECLEQAIALDPQFALPYVGLADFHLASSAIGGMASQEGMPKARTWRSALWNSIRICPKPTACWALWPGTMTWIGRNPSDDFTLRWLMNPLLVTRGSGMRCFICLRSGAPKRLTGRCNRCLNRIR